MSKTSACGTPQPQDHGTLGAQCTCLTPRTIRGGIAHQWEGAGMPPVFCILEGSANISAAMASGGRQLVSEPPTQLWGATVHEGPKSATAGYLDPTSGSDVWIRRLVLGGGKQELQRQCAMPVASTQLHSSRGKTYSCCWTPQGRRRAGKGGLHVEARRSMDRAGSRGQRPHSRAAQCGCAHGPVPTRVSGG